MDKRDIQALIDRLEAIKKRQVELIDEQIALTRQLTEAASLYEEARAWFSGEYANLSERNRRRSEGRRMDGK